MAKAIFPFFIFAFHESTVYIPKKAPVGGCPGTRTCSR